MPKKKANNPKAAWRTKCEKWAAEWQKSLGPVLAVDALPHTGRAVAFHNDDEIYHADTDRDSSSTIKSFADDQTTYYHERVLKDRKDDKESTSKVNGTLVHRLLFEPGTIQERYYHANVEKPKRNSNAGKAEYAKHVDLAKGREILWEGQLETANQAVFGLVDHDLIQKLIFRPMVREVGVQWLLSEWAGVKLPWGLPMKAKFDALVFVGRRSVIKIDLKTASEPHPKRFQWNALDFRYHWQQCIYDAAARAAGLRVIASVLIVVGTSWPHHSAVYQFTPDAQNEARMDLLRVFEELAGKRRHAYEESLTPEDQRRLYRPSWTRGIVQVGPGIRHGKTW